MEKFLKKAVLFLLMRMVKSRLRKFNGKVIAVTGSVGKTSTKEAIFSVLNSQFRVKKCGKSMNTEFGVMLTILDIESGYRSAVKWSWYLLKGFYNSLFAEHSEVLLLEFGVDKPKDMDFLLKIVRPDIAVFTGIFPAHLAEGQFKDMNDIFEEKRKLVDSLDEDGIAIINVDNPFGEHLAKGRNKKMTRTYGKNNKDADFLIGGVAQDAEGLKFLVHHKDEKYRVEAGVLGEYQVYVLTPALICAKVLKMDMPAALGAMKRYVLPPGRMGIIEGKKGSVILDSSYNSSPEALKEALKVLGSVGEGKCRVAVLGAMNELGSDSRVMHELIGEIVPKYADVLLTVGGDSKYFAEKAIESGMTKSNVHVFKTAMEAVEFFKDKVKKNDIILVKGSQNNVQLERFVKEMMEHPEDAKKLLVRQEGIWKANL